MGDYILILPKSLSKKFFLLLFVGYLLDINTCISFQEDPDTRLAIQEALSMMVGAYTSLEGAPRTLMEALVASNLIKVSHQDMKGV